MKTVILTENETTLLAQLRSESAPCVLETAGGWAYREVYLDNVPMRHTDPRNFAATLSSLKKKGLYQPEGSEFSSHFGRVDVATMTS
jgi:hypothetical protein